MLTRVHKNIKHTKYFIILKYMYYQVNTFLDRYHDIDWAHFNLITFFIFIDKVFGRVFHYTCGICLNINKTISETC